MKVLLTGASSLTGCWFAKSLVEAGHEVVAVFTKRKEDYADSRRRSRNDLVTSLCEAVWETHFGSDRFIALCKRERWDILAHHGAQVTDYRSPNFDATQAFSQNTLNLVSVFNQLRESNPTRVLITGTFSEKGEGLKSATEVVDSTPYNLSKRLTAELFQFHCAKFGIPLGKFVLPNPFGAYEDARYTSFLITSWLTGETPSCNTPDYVRDNAHAPVLGKAYVQFAESLAQLDQGYIKTSPSGYVETQGQFSLRLARAMEHRLNRPCPVSLKSGHQMDEPRISVNTEPCHQHNLPEVEKLAWDQMADYYLELNGANR